MASIEFLNFDLEKRSFVRTDRGRGSSGLRTRADRGGGGGGQKMAKFVRTCFMDGLKKIYYAMSAEKN